MYICACKIQFLLPESSSLKDKRKTVKSILERLRQRFPLAVAEINYLDSLQRGEIGIAAISNNLMHLEKLLAKSIAFVESDHRIEVTEVEKYFY